ncbi:uncharacterized protein LOC144098573 isoform X1 [Amblyomma americanum]
MAANATTEPLTVVPDRTEANVTTTPSPSTFGGSAANSSASATEKSSSPDEGGSGFLGDAGPGMAIFLGALAVISVGVIIVLCVSVCITASKRAKRRAHFQNKIRSQCPPCPQCNEPCKQDPGVYHVDMCDVHGPVPPPGQPPASLPAPMPSVREEEEEEDVGNPFFVRSRDRPERSAGGDSGVSSQIARTPDPFAVDANHHDRDGVLVSRPKLLQMPVRLFKDNAPRVDTKPLWRGDSVDDGVVLPGAGDLTAEDDNTDAGIVADASVQTAARGQANHAFLKDIP